MKNLVMLVILVVLALLTGCNQESEQVLPGTNRADQLAQIQAYLDTIPGGDAFTLADSGYFFRPDSIVPGAPTQASGSVLSLHYVEKTLVDGQLVLLDSQWTGSKPVVALQGADAIFPIGLDYALRRMNEGEVYEFFIPGTLGYQDFSFSTLIPAQATLYFKVKLVDIRSTQEVFDQELDSILSYINLANLNDTVAVPLEPVEPLQGGLMYYKKLQQGNEGQQPQSGDLVSITYTGRFLELDSANTPFQVITNSNLLEVIYDGGQLIPGLDLGIGQMEVGERALLMMPSSLAYGESAAVFPGSLPIGTRTFTQVMIDRKILPDYVARIPPYQPLIFDITLRGID